MIEKIIKYCEDGLSLAQSQIASEKMSGNIVKAEHWKGEASAYTAILCELESLKATLKVEEGEAI